MKWIKNLKYAIGAATLLAMLAVVPMVEGGGRWRGIDPELQYGGHTVNVWVEWPEENTCEINSTITMDIHAPGAKLVAESTGAFPCAGGPTTIQTSTTIQNAAKGRYLTEANVLVPASGTFPVQVLTYVDGVQKGTCSGYSNQPFTCSPVKVY